MFEISDQKDHNRISLFEWKLLFGGASYKMWTFTLLSISLFALVSATWRPIVGPSSSSFNKKVPFGDSHTYYGNEFLSEYSGLGEDHLLVPNLSGPHESAILESDSLGSLGKSPEIAVIVNLNYCEM